eukprot:scaffold193_cov255-Pinguiococcus_pyrenoidosus.AAC.36
MAEAVAKMPSLQLTFIGSALIGEEVQIFHGGRIDHFDLASEEDASTCQARQHRSGRAEAV